ncbi:diguanylate cyclase [Vallitalea pronyensis]|uniref:Diguanylate cyclase n=1 Tax=Vallitalea pronyensis TaxID=1348613 RepID=A0A8J8MKY7_9FIRM|nr:diguanylate cyclase [Vallitalea pronyensis]QUI23404.1 diguanylate cyclase [Vallitalea pronyensis]
MVDKQLAERMQDAIDYIEEHLLEKITTEDISKSIYMSKSSFYNIFSSILGTTVKSYIRRRRLSLSAKDLIHSDESILNIALQYQYSTYESYSRAFKRLFGISPQQYRHENVYTNMFPRVVLTYHSYEGGNVVVNRQINKDAFLEQMGHIVNGFVLDIDIDAFDRINANYGYYTGDKVLVAIPKRINKVLKSYQLDVTATRINGDEFAVIIKDQTKEIVKAISADIIKAVEVEPFVFNDVKFNVTVSIGISDFTVDNHARVMKHANEAMLSAKNKGRNQYQLYD